MGILQSIGFNLAVGEVLRTQTEKAFRPYGPIDSPPVAVAFVVADGEEAERHIKLLQPQLLPLGYRAFWTKLHEPNGILIGDAVAVLNATDHFAIVDVANPDGANYNLTADDVRAKLKSWEAICRFEIVGASHDWVALVFETLPADLCRFVEDIFLFCSDSFGSPMGTKAKGEAARRMAAARSLCPELSPAFWNAHDAKFELALDHVGETPFAALVGEPSSFKELLRRETLQNVQLFAHRLVETKYAWLWWD